MTTNLLPFEQSLGYQTRIAQRAIQRRLQSIIEPHGVTLGMWYFLRVLWIHDGLTQQELSTFVGTMAPTTLSAIRSMESNGFIFRKKNEKDARKINIYLTDKAKSLKEILLPRARALLTDATVGLTASEVASLLRMLKIVQDNLKVEPATLSTQTVHTDKLD